MQSLKRSVIKIGITSALLLCGVLAASAAQANDRHRGERINAHLDVLAIIAAFSGDPLLAFALDRRGDRIEDRYAHANRHGGGHRHHRRSRHWQGSHQLGHRHFGGCGHSEMRRRIDHRHKQNPHRRSHRRRH